MAELKLKVSLDTSYLRGQISRLPLEFAGANVSIRPKFDRKTIVNEFALLNRYISSKKFNIVINTNLEAEIKNADRLVKALGRVQQAASGAKGGLPIGTQVLRRTKEKGGFAAAEIKALFGAAVQGGLIDDKTLASTRAQMVTALGSIGRDSIAGLLNGLKSGDADIQKAAQMLGGNLITSFKTVLGIASPSKEFRKLGEAAGQGFEQGLLRSIEIAEQSATRKMQRMLDRLARMALMMSGMSGPEIGRQIAQARALPALNFGATTPRTSVSIGPSSTGRALPPGASRPELPGTAFGRQKYLPTALGEELKEVLRGAANAFLDSIRQNIRTVTVSDMGAPPSRQGLLQGGAVAGLLPGRASAASVLELNNILAGAIREYFKSVARDLESRGKVSVPTTPLLPSASSRNPPLLPPIGGTSGSIRISTGAYVGQPSMMRAPSIPPSMGGGGAPPIPPRGGGGGGGAFGGTQFNMPQLPGAGLVREIGEEFGFAAKQVLLFGAAYKGLAFLQSFPGQVGAAVGALQSFRNTIEEISPSAKEAADSSQFILDIVEKYNTPLQSARDGFVKLYASMQPAGFSGDEIRDLFLGISQTAATFGMSADKVDRVNYAFAQMASKGQVMSEELKGQLGDVLPGAMAIFAEAAGFKGPEAITKFSKALEDGAYKGGAMKVLLTNVGSIMRQEFGPGAEGAARTFQGVMNRMQNSLKLLYEAFEPVAVGFLNSVVMPMTSGLKTVTDGLNAFFRGAATKTSGGFAIAQELEKLRPTFDGLRENAGQLIPVLGQIAQVALGVGKAFLQIASNPFVGYVARVYLNVLALTTAINILNLRALIPMIANFARSLYALVAFAIQCVSTGSAVQRLGMAVQVTGLMLRTFFATTGIGLVLVGIGLLTERFISMNQALADTKAKAAGAADAIRAMSQTEARQASQQYDRQAQSLKGLSEEIEDGKMKGKAWIEVTKEQAEALKSAGVTVSDVRGSLQVQPMRVGGAYQKVEGLAAEAKFRVRGLDYQDKQVEQQSSISPIPPGTGEDEASKKKTSLESYYSLQDQLAKAQTQADIDRIEAAFEYRKQLINNVYDLEETRANSIQKEAIAHQRAISNIFLDLQKKQIDARLSMMKAEGSVAGGAPTGSGSSLAGSGGSLAGMTQYITGDPSHPNYKPDHGTIANYHDHLAFASRKAAIEAYDRLTKSGIQVTEFQGFGRGVTGPHSGPGSAHHKGLAMDIPGAQWGGSGAIGAREFAGSARVRATLGMGGGVGATPGKVTPDRKRDVLAEQAKINAGKQAAISLTNAEAEAQQRLVIETEKYLAQIFGIAEKQLQTGMLQKKTAMLRAGATDQEIEDAMSLEEINLRHAAGVEAANRQIAANNKLIAEGSPDKDILNKNTAAQLRLISRLNEELPKATKAQADLNKAQKEAAFTGRVAALKEEIKLLLIANDAERRLAELRKEYKDEAKVKEIFNLETVRKNIADTRELVDGFVSSTSSDYKGFLKAVISGEDAADALKQFQEGLKDRVLTIFLDFAMKPVEDFLKEGFFNLFKPKGLSGTGAEQEATKDPVVATNVNTTATNANTEELKKLTTALSGAAGGEDQSTGLSSAIKGIRLSSGIDTSVAGIGGPAAAGFDAASVFGNPEALKESFAGIQSSIGESMNGIVSSFESGATSLATTLPSWSDSLATKLPATLTQSTEEVKGETPGFQESLGKVAQGIGIAATTIMGIAAGISQIKKKGTSNVLMGIGSILASIGGGIGGFTKLFAADGGVAAGGWKPLPLTAFANGGMVSGPTLGLIGEGKYNEAIVPLPNGRSIPVEMTGAGGGSLRDAMGQAPGQNTSPILNMSFQSTTINGVEYVSRDQLEQAMAQTRREASRDGAQRGMTMTLDKLQQSPTTRRRVGI